MKIPNQHLFFEKRGIYHAHENVLLLNRPTENQLGEPGTPFLQADYLSGVIFNEILIHEN